MQKLRLFLWLAVIAAVGAMILLLLFGDRIRQIYWRYGPSVQEKVLPQPDTPTLGGPFELTDQSGKTVSSDRFKGKYMLVFFGFTYCPDICPTTLQVISDALDQLGDSADKIQPIFITVDPERDSPQVLAEYLSHFHPKIVGLTGDADDIAEVARAYRVYYAKTGEGDDYLMEHLTITYLMDREGQYFSHFNHNTNATDMARMLRSLP